MSNNATTGSVFGKIAEFCIYNRVLTDAEIFLMTAYPLGPGMAIWKSSATSNDWNMTTNW